MSCGCGIWARLLSKILVNKRIPRNFRGSSIILLTTTGKIIIITWSIGAWRSLVSRLVRVQEASGSNPDAPTKNLESASAGSRFFIGMMGFKRPLRKLAGGMFLARGRIHYSIDAPTAGVDME